MAFQIKDWLPSLSDVRKAPVVALLERAVTAVLAMISGWFAADYVSPGTRLGHVVVFFVAAFLAVGLWAWIGYARRQHADGGEGDTLTSVEKPEPRALTPYELERKLAAIDDALTILRDESKILAEGRYLLHSSKEKRAFADPDYLTTYQGEIAEYSLAVYMLEQRLEDLGRKLAPFPDIKSKIDRNHQVLRVALSDYVRLLVLIRANIKTDASDNDVKKIMGVRSIPVGNYIEDTINQRAHIERQLVEMRHHLSP